MIPTTEQIEKKLIPRLKNTFGNTAGMSGKNYDNDIASLSAAINQNSADISSLSSSVSNISNNLFYIGKTAPTNFSGLFFNTSNY